MTWTKKYKFSDLYEMSSGISSKPEQAGHGNDFLSFSSVFNNHFLPEILPDQMDVPEKDEVTYSIKEGDIFLTRTSETLDELGMSSVALKDYPKATYSGFLKRLRPINPDETYPKFMAFYLRSKLFRKTMTNNAIMTLRASLNQQIFSYLDLLLPKYEEQKKIGDLLYNIQQKIELNNRINEELESMTKLIYGYWFVQFDFPNKTGKPYKSSGGKMVYNKVLKREVPEGWEVKSISDILNIISENTSPDQLPPRTPYVGIEHIPRKRITLSNWSTAKNAASQKCKFQEHDFLFGKIRPYFHKVVISHMSGIASTDATVLRVKQKQDLGFALQVVSSNHFIQVATKTSTGSKMPRADWNVLLNYSFAKPPDPIIIKYQSQMDTLLGKLKNCVLENKELSSLRDWLLPMLMNGQVKIGDIQEELSKAAEPEASYSAT